MDNPAQNDHPLIDPIRLRWSPRAFDGKAVAQDDLAALFEAARWAASAFNEQPWRWLLASREDEAAFAELLDCLNPWNRQWAGAAGALAVAVAAERFQRNDQPNAHAWYDLGQACAHLALQATALGLFVHPMAGIEPEKARERFRIPEGYAVVTGLAVGHAGDPATLPEELKAAEQTPRRRRPLDELVFAGRWGETHPLFKA